MMMRIVSIVLALAMSLTLTGKLLAADGGSSTEGKPPCEGRQRPFGIAERIERLTKDLNLTDEQKTKLEALKKDLASKFGDARKKMDDILTAEQKKARDEAVKAAREAGKGMGECSRPAARQ